MAWTNWGFDGTINEAQWAELAPLLGNGYIAKDTTSCVVTAVGGARKVSVSTGTLFGDGIVSKSDAVEEVTLTTPANGQWYVIALKREWATNTASLVAVAGATTTTATPTFPPTTLPTLLSNPGVKTEQPIAWAWCNSANTTVVVVDMRQFPVRTLPPTVDSAPARDGKYPSPAQGLTIWRNDLGATQTYYGLYNASTNPGGRDVARWYITGRNDGLVPLNPTAVDFVSGTGTVNALGQVNFTNCTQISLRGVFTSEYANYKILLWGFAGNPANADFRFLSGTTPAAGGNYAYTGYSANNTSVSIFANGSNTLFPIANMAAWDGVAHAEINLYNPQLASFTNIHVDAGSNSGQLQARNLSGYHNLNTAYDGIAIFTLTGTMWGRAQVFGYND